jgi:hypothetical protein
MNYSAVQKGSGFVYVHYNIIFKQSRKHGEVLYLKCSHENCGATAKVQTGNFELQVMQTQRAEQTRRDATEMCSRGVAEAEAQRRSRRDAKALKPKTGRV